MGEVSAVRFNASLGDNAVCLSSEGDVSVEMARILKNMPGSENMPTPEASLVLEINLSHPVADKIKSLYESDKEALSRLSKILFGSACLISGLAVENVREFTDLVRGEVI